MTARPPTRWGGRAGRFANFHRAVETFADPFAQTDEQVALELHYDNWLLARFAPMTRSLRLFPAPVELRPGSPMLKAHACLLVELRTGPPELQFVYRTDDDMRSAATARRLAKHFSARCVPRSRAQIRNDPALLHALDYLRRAAEGYSEVHPRPDRQIRQIVASRTEIRVEELRKLLVDRHAVEVDAAVARLSVAGELVIHFQHGEGYGKRTHIGCA